MGSFQCDFHIHSCLSPCADITMTPGEIESVCVRKGIDWIAITDHNSAGNTRVITNVLRRSGIAVIPGIEIHTIEDIHVLAYFPSVSSAEAYSRWLKDEKLPAVEIDPEISGYQLYVNEDGAFTGLENTWLGQPTRLSIDETIESVVQSSGICVMAHVDRKMGLISQLGFIPPEYLSLPLEVAFEGTLKSKSLGRNLMHSSDAHSLELIRPTMLLTAEKRSFEDFREAITSGGRRSRIIWD